MKIGGTWNTKIAFQFHKLMKDAFRQMIDADPDASGSALDILRYIDFDRRLAVQDEGDFIHPNEEFILRMVDNYRNIFSSLNPPMMERLLEKKMTDFVISLFRNDSAYRSRIGGLITFIVSNYANFSGPEKNHLAEIRVLRNWWIMNDRRSRTYTWIDWFFNYIMKKYEADVNNGGGFYMGSVNFCFAFICDNKHMWEIIDDYHPDKWFGKIVGSEINELYNRCF